MSNPPKANSTSLLYFVLLVISTHFPSYLFAQETSSQVSGKIFSHGNKTLPAATVTAIHEPTKNVFITQTLEDGSFHFFNLKPGGPYTVIISHTGFETLKRENIFLGFNSSDHSFDLSENFAAGFVLKQKEVAMTNVTVTNLSKGHTGIESDISFQTLQNLPSISRSLQDYLRVIPQAKVTGEGVISLAGQNNRFNAFFIDGANNNDILGLAVTGTNGGQTGSPPISIEALEQIKVLLSPYDVQYGNFTGGSINAITRSGSNQSKASAWYYFRNQDFAGRSPQYLEKPGFPGVLHRPKLSNFFNQTFGVWNSGPLIKNKLFYFMSVEKQDDVRPQLFNILDYKGSSNVQQLAALTDFLKTRYQYDPGSFVETKDALNATRIIIKLDWNESIKNKLMLSYRYNNAERISPRVQSSGTSLLFQHNGIEIPARTHAASFEWKRFFNHSMSNRFLLTFTDQQDDRKWLGKPFPGVVIQDGSGSVLFGSDGVSGAQSFSGKDITLFNAFKLAIKNHLFTLGTDINYSKLKHTAIPNYFGLYQFRSLSDFMNGAFPSRYQRTLPIGNDSIVRENYILSDFATVRTSAFLNDEMRFGARLKINVGLRLDVNSILFSEQADRFFNDTAVNIIAKYYSLEGAITGRNIKPKWALSPRIGLNYRMAAIDMTFRGGAGVFVGHGVNVWASNIVSSNRLVSLDINPQQYGFRFIADPYQQPGSQAFNINQANVKGDLNLRGKNFKNPSVFRTSLSIDKKIKDNWSFLLEAIFTKNIQEALFKNVNILPPNKTASAPDVRNVYSLNSAPAKIPLRSNGSNPYSNIFLLTNNNDKKGSAYSYTFSMGRHIRSFTLNGSYTYARSKTLFEISGAQTPIAAQWRNMETINGRNYTSVSTSDNELQHRITAWTSKKISYVKKRMATTISMFYNGQSGSPYSYVYNGSIVNDNGNREIFDLIYVPTVSELNAMNYLSIRDHNGQVIYTPQQQKDYLNEFIHRDKYLKTRRGKFAERNGARLPFTHIIDVRLQQDFSIDFKKRKIGFTVTYDVFNFTNMLNKNWGRIYHLTNDVYPLIQFAGYANTAGLTPQYQFAPIEGNPYSLQSSTVPGNSARWLSQLGVKINFN